MTVLLVLGPGPVVNIVRPDAEPGSQEQLFPAQWVVVEDNFTEWVPLGVPLADGCSPAVLPDASSSSEAAQVPRCGSRVNKVPAGFLCRHDAAWTVHHAELPAAHAHAIVAPVQHGWLIRTMRLRRLPIR